MAARIQSDGFAPLTASAVRLVHTRVLSKRVFRRCCGHRCRIDQLQFSLSVSAVSCQNFKFGFIVSTQESCASKVSRASGICSQKSALRRIVVDKPVGGLVQIRLCAFGAI
jgi:hypothetical protein